jgi:hypothetical protein
LTPLDKQELPDFGKPLELPQQHSEQPGHVTEEASLLGGGLQGLRAKIAPPKPANAKNSDAFFDYGVGLATKNAVYTLVAVSILWEVFINSPFFERKSPILTLDQFAGASLESAGSLQQQQAVKEAAIAVHDTRAADWPGGPFVVHN